MVHPLYGTKFKKRHLLPRAEAPARLHLFLSGRQRGQDPQSSPENSSGKYRGDPDLLPEQGHRHGAPAESRESLRPGDRADHCGHSVAVEQIGDGLRSLFFDYSPVNSELWTAEIICLTLPSRQHTDTQGCKNAPPSAVEPSPAKGGEHF